MQKAEQITAKIADAAHEQVDATHLLAETTQPLAEVYERMNRTLDELLESQRKMIETLRKPEPGTLARELTHSTNAEHSDETMRERNL